MVPNSSNQIIGTNTSSTTIGGNTVRSGLADQFNTLRDQLDKLADDASFNGINLLRGDKLKITFNETGTSSIDIQVPDGKSVDTTQLGLPTTLEAKSLDSDTGIDSLLDNVKTAVSQVRSQSSTFGSNLSVVENRQDFTKKMMNTLQTGASNLTLADMNEEAANIGGTADPPVPGDLLALHGQPGRPERASAPPLSRQLCGGQFRGGPFGPPFCVIVLLAFVSGL